MRFQHDVIVVLHVPFRGLRLQAVEKERAAKMADQAEKAAELAASRATFSEPVAEGGGADFLDGLADDSVDEEEIDDLF